MAVQQSWSSGTSRSMKLHTGRRITGTGSLPGKIRILRVSSISTPSWKNWPAKQKTCLHSWTLQVLFFLSLGFNICMVSTTSIQVGYNFYTMHKTVIQAYSSKAYSSERFKTRPALEISSAISYFITTLQAKINLPTSP